MITPNVMAQSQYYKIGDWVTFAWNYTSVSSMPSAVDVLASCSANQATYTIGLNMTVDHTQKVLWDTGDYQKTATIPLLTETYTLIVYDAGSSISATPESGYLAVADNFYFGMYSPQAYTPLAGKLPWCNEEKRCGTLTWEPQTGNAQLAGAACPPPSARPSPSSSA